MTARTRTRTGIAATGLIAAALALSGCASSDPLAEEPSPTSDGDTIVVGSQAYYSNEIIAEIYAQALENAGYPVARQFSIGQRDAYLPSIENGEIGVFPEYTGSLLQQAFDPETEARTADEVYDALVEALPENLTALEQSSATDQDSYTVTQEFADEYDLVEIGDLANVDEELVLGGPAELEERPYGPSGVSDIYGVDVAFSATGDATVEELLAGTVNVANVFTADPRIQTDDLVPLEDPEGLFLATNIVPIVNSDIAEEVAEVIDPISEALTPEGLVAMNVQSTVDEMSPEAIASEWLESNGLG